ncbi:MAG: preprotein translocase subunit SecE [Thermoguttaceae bacterium]|nr:preprotein translocase subunit SecE [Thermoguttaceae bacterium]
MFSQLMKELFSTNSYKSSQGRVARRLTFIGLSLVFIWGGYSFFSAGYFGAQGAAIGGAIIAALGVWASYRVINYAQFADFLVSVEAEMTKVSWPSKRDLFANTKVVLIFMALFTALIYAYDIVFRSIFSLVG